MGLVALPTWAYARGYSLPRLTALDVRRFSGSLFALDSASLDANHKRL
jgi:hypothetical protein